MPDSLFTQYRNAQFQGPTTSDEINERTEEYYKDQVYLINKAGQNEENLIRVYRRLLKDHFSLMKQVEDLTERVSTLEADTNRISFGSSIQIDNDRFEGTQWEIPSVNQLYLDDRHGVLTLPKIDNSSISKLKFTNDDGTDVLPSTFEAIARNVTPSADDELAIIDSSDPYYAVINQVGKIWERNVVRTAPFSGGAIVDLYVRVPSDLSLIADSNSIVIHPYPMMGCELVSVEYSTKADIQLNNSDDYTPLNSDALYDSNAAAVGWVPPGGWDGDEIEDCGPKNFYFDPEPVTGLKIRLHQSHYFYDSGKYIYSYGLSNLDVRYDKFLETGKTIIKYDVPSGGTISSVEDIVPKIWNVSEAELSDVFSYKLIWETSYNSGVYTEVQPGSPANRVWIEVTLNKTLGNGTPALSSLALDYDGGPGGYGGY